MNQKGFTLIETLVSLGIALTSSLAILTMVMFALESQINVTSLSDYSNLQDTIKMYISNPVLCPKTITNVNNNTVNLNGRVIQPGTRLTSGSIINQVAIALISPTSNPNEYSAYLQLSGMKNPSSLGPKPLRAVNIPLTIQIDNNGNVLACSLNNAGNIQTNCTQSGGVWTQDGNSNNWFCKYN